MHRAPNVAPLLKDRLRHVVHKEQLLEAQLSEKQQFHIFIQSRIHVHRVKFRFQTCEARLCLRDLERLSELGELLTRRQQLWNLFDRLDRLLVKFIRVDVRHHDKRRCRVRHFVVILI